MRKLTEVSCKGANHKSKNTSFMWGRSEGANYTANPNTMSMIDSSELTLGLRECEGANSSSSPNMVWMSLSLLVVEYFKEFVWA